MLADQTPEPAVGQVWADNDPRSVGRTVRIDAIDATHAHVTILTNSRDRQYDLDHDTQASWRQDTVGRKARIKLSRLRPTGTGYRYLRTEPAEGGAPDA